MANKYKTEDNFLDLDSLGVEKRSVKKQEAIPPEVPKQSAPPVDPLAALYMPANPELAAIQQRGFDELKAMSKDARSSKKQA